MKSNVVSLFPSVTIPEPKKRPDPKPQKPKRQCVRITIGTNPDTGKPIRKPFYGKTKKEAEQKKKLWEAEQIKKQLEDKQRADTGASDADRQQLLASWINKWLIAYNTTGSFSTSYATDRGGDDLSAFLGTMRLCDIRQIDIQRYAASLAEKSKSYVSKRKTTTNAIFRSAMQNLLIRANPCDGVKWQSAGAGTHRYLDPWEIALIIKHALVYRAGLWAMLMLFAGLRRGEAIALRWEDIDREAGVIHITKAVHFEGNRPVVGPPKTASSVRDVPILPPLRALLDKIPMPPLSPFVCAMEDGSILTETGFSRAWQTYQNTISNIVNGDTATPVSPGRRSDKDEQRYGQKPRVQFSIRAHDLRHSFASILYDADVDIKTAQKLLGHATPDMTMRVYTHLSSAKQSTSVDKLAAFTKDLSTKLDAFLMPESE